MSWEYIDGTEPASLRTPQEAARIKKADEKRARGDYNMRLQRSTPNTIDRMPVESTQAWADYMAALAQRKGGPEDYANLMRKKLAEMAARDPEPK